MQLHTRHIPLNKYLKRINRVDSEECPTCGAESEMVRHFLLECPGYAYERWVLERQLRKRQKEMTIENLLGNAEAIVPLTNFISASGRFMHNT
jgi:hypothetical protein